MKTGTFRQIETNGLRLRAVVEGDGHKRPDATMLEGTVDPDPLLAWLTADDVACYAEEFRQSGFRRPLNRYRNQERDRTLLPELSEKTIASAT